MVAFALMCGLGTAAALAATDAPGDPSVNFQLPKESAPGGRVTAQGRIAGLEGRAVVEAELLGDGGWRPLAKRGAGNGRFRLALTLPGQGTTAKVRAAIVIDGRRIATSAVSRVRLLETATGGGPQPIGAAPEPAPSGTPATTSATPPAGPPAPSEPEVPEEPPGEEPPGEEPEEPPVEPPHSLYWGAWIDPGTPVQPAPVNPTAISKFENGVANGKRASILESYSAFFNCVNGSGGACSAEYAFPQTQLDAIRQRGAIPLFTWASESSSGEPNQSDFQLADVAGGKWDTYIRKWATAAKAWGHPFFLRFDWEMNGNWFPWGKGINGNQEGEYVEAWQHVHDIFSEVGATNAAWVWCPFTGPRPVSGFYPGDAYVDWTCLDGYNNTLTTAWRSFSQIFTPAYKEVTELAPSKPMLIAETASSEAGAPAGKSKAEWITQMFEALPTQFPAVHGLLWFDYEEGGKGWPLETSAAAEDAFAAGISNPRYLGNTFGGLASPIPVP